MEGGGGGGGGRGGEWRGEGGQVEGGGTRGRGGGGGRGGRRGRGEGGDLKGGEGRKRGDEVLPAWIHPWPSLSAPQPLPERGEWAQCLEVRNPQQTSLPPGASLTLTPMKSARRSSESCFVMVQSTSKHTDVVGGQSVSVSNSFVYLSCC